jgi:hypothetical protein
MTRSSTSKTTSRRRRSIAIALGVGIALCASSASALPTLDQLMADFNFSKDDVQRVRKGELVEGKTKETSEKEIAVVMVFLVKQPVKTLISSFETGRGFRNDPQVLEATEIKEGAGPDDLKAVVLKPGGDKETKRYLDAEPGDTLNLSEPEIAAFQALKAAGKTGEAQVEAEIRRQLLARYEAYRAKGLAGIAPYARGKNKQTEPAADLRRATESAVGLKKYVPAFYDLLLNYPQGSGAGLEQSFFCIRYGMSGRPNFTLRQRISMPVEDAYVAADREFYVSHDYNETQAVGVLLPAEGGTMVGYLNRTTTDQLGGFGASAKQAIGRSMMAKQIKAIFEKTRADFHKQ